MSDRDAMKRAVSEMTRLRLENQTEDTRIGRIVDELEQTGTTKVDQLDVLAKTASFHDDLRNFFCDLLVYIPFLVNDLAQVKIAKMMDEYGQEHGERSVRVYALSIVSKVAIPAVGSTMFARGLESSLPRRCLPSSPAYEGPGINIDFEPVITMPLATFIVLKIVVTAICVSANISDDHAALFNAGVGLLAAAKQSFDAWRVKKAKHRSTARTCSDGKERRYEPWLLESSLTEDIAKLSNHRVALKSFVSGFGKDFFLESPRNFGVALVHPGTWATAFALASSAGFTHAARTETDPTYQLMWNNLSARSAIGVKGFVIGMTNQAGVQWFMQKVTFDTWTLQRVNCIGEGLQTAIVLFFTTMGAMFSWIWEIVKTSFRKMRS